MLSDDVFTCFLCEEPLTPEESEELVCRRCVDAHTLPELEEMIKAKRKAENTARIKWMYQQKHRQGNI